MGASVSVWFFLTFDTQNLTLFLLTYQVREMTTLSTILLPRTQSYLPQ